MKKTFLILALSFIVLLSKAQGSWKLYDNSSIKGTISGTVKKGHVFETTSGDYFIINDFTLEIVITIMPDVTILFNGSDYKLIIEDFDDPVICKKLTGIIKTSINGDFNGWEGETVFRMLNGQIWQQSSYSYEYDYSYCPNVLIYKFNNRWNMKVEEVEETIEVTRLK